MKNLLNGNTGVGGVALASTDFMLSLTDRSDASSSKKNNNASRGHNLPTLNMLSEISRNMGAGDFGQNLPTISPINNILRDTSHLLFNNGQLLSDS
jgi:hypothetical protein